jgi:hypothetical protein
MEDKSICEIVREAEQNYISGSVSISKYVNFSLHENIEKIDAYINSKHITGDTDSQGREKPFFNIVTAARNIWYRATDIDRKNIRIKASKAKDIILSFLANVHLQNWMKKANFGQFLNNWGRSLATYGSAVVKFVEKDGELCAEVIPWNRLIVDAVDFEAGPVIEKLYLTPAQLKERKGYDQEVVDALLDATTTRKTLDKQNKDSNNANFIELYEVHGLFPLEMLTDKEADSDTFVQQVHVVSFIESEERIGEYDDYCLYSGKEKNPYMITHLIEEDGRTQAIGAVEHLFEAQWMMNHSVKAIKDQLDLASKLIFQTSDGNFVGENALTSIENGEILIHEPNQPLTQINNNSHDVQSLQSFGEMWKGLAQEITSTPDALMGANAPSGTAWRQVEALQQEAHSLFELMTENKGLAIERMLREYVIPFLKKQLNNADEVTATLDVNGIDKIDAMYIKNEAIRRENERAVNQILSGEVAQPLDIAGQTANIQNELSSLGGQRFYKPSEVDWKTEFKDFEWEVEVDVTGEAKDNQSNIATLSTVLQTIAGNPMVLTDPNAKMIFNKIIEMTGAVSPLEIQEIPKTQPQPQAPQPTQIPPIGGS